MKIAALWLALAVLPLVVKADYILTIMIFSFILGVVAVSFNLIFGFTGQLSMFNAAAFGIAAYSTFLLMTNWHLSFWAALVLTLCFVMLLSLVVGTICFMFQLQEFYFALVTMAFAELARLIVLNWTTVTNGTLGLLVLDKPTIGIGSFSMRIADTLDWYYFSGLALLLSVGITQMISRSWIGRAFGAIRLNENLAQTLGISIFRYKLLSFTLANVMAAVAGTLYAFYTGYIEPSYLSTDQSLNIISMVLIGGTGTAIGPIVGAFILTGLPHVIELGAEQRNSLRRHFDYDHPVIPQRNCRHISGVAPCCLRDRALRSGSAALRPSPICRSASRRARSSAYSGRTDRAKPHCSA